MEFFIVGIISLAILWAIFKLLKSGQGPSANNWPFYAKKLLTKPEQVLYFRLVKALPECIVLAQVQLSRVLGVKKGFNFGQWHNRINRLSLDYLVCLKDSTVVAAIELDDSTHSRSDRQYADRRKETALASAGITLLRWNVASLPDESSIRKALAS
jgi:hypothetical protein